jgi:hypothetical protein
MAEQKIDGVPAAAVIKVVQRIERKHGVCHPSMLVEAARSERSPLHSLSTGTKSGTRSNGSSR